MSLAVRIMGLEGGTASVDDGRGNMSDQDGVLMMQRLLLAGTLGLAVARKAAAILDGEPASADPLMPVPMVLDDQQAPDPRSHDGAVLRGSGTRWPSSTAGTGTSPDAGSPSRIAAALRATARPSVPASSSLCIIRTPLWFVMSACLSIVHGGRPAFGFMMRTTSDIPRPTGAPCMIVGQNRCHSTSNDPR